MTYKNVLRLHNCPSCNCADKVDRREADREESKRTIKRRQARLLGQANNHNKPWTEDEYKLLDSGLTTQQIAIRLGRSYYAVRKKIHSRNRALAAREESGYHEFNE